MNPYFERDGITIYHGDCFEILPSLEPVDLVITDPPYGVAKHLPNTSFGRDENASRSRLAKATDWGELKWDAGAPTAEVLGAVIGAGKWAIIFGGNYFALPPSPCWLVWDKDNGKNHYADCELAWTNLRKAVRKFKWRWQGMLQEDMKNKEPRLHPTQKPLAVMKWAIQQAPSDCNTILDPFMGAGTALRAAQDLGRKAIGIEIEERYCEMAADRLLGKIKNG